VIPTLDADRANRVGDLANDLLAVARGEEVARKDLADDLAAETDTSAAQPQEAARKFGRQLAEAVASVTLIEQSAQQLALTSWTLVAATELSDRQIRALQAELRSQLSSVGVPPDRADAVVAEVPAVQRAVTTRPRRWYEVL
jgi:hypothetical protein